VESNLDGFDFTTTWRPRVEDYPELRAQPESGDTSSDTLRVHIRSVEFSPETVDTEGSTHDLTINVEGLSPDNEVDVFTVTIPETVDVVNANVTNSNVDLVDTPTSTNSMEFVVDPTETTTAQIEIELTLEPPSDGTD